MNNNPDSQLDALFAAARAQSPDTSRVEFGFETRLAARIREESAASLSAWAWKLCPFFAAIALGVAWWDHATPRSDADAQIIVQAAEVSDERLLLAHMTGDRG